MDNNAQDIEKLLRVFSADKIISPDQIQEVFSGIINILAENKKGVESLNSETKQQLQDHLKQMASDHNKLYKAIESDLKRSKAEIEKLTKETNNRAFKSLQELIGKIKMPKDGVDGKDGQDGLDGSPDSPVEVRNKLESLKGEERLDVSAIRGLEKLFGTVKTKGKEMLVGGIRFFENLADVSIVVTKKRQDLLAQYNATNNRWENGVAITVSTTAPTSPQTNDVWIDCS